MLSSNMLRRSATILAVAVIAAGGLTIGMGTAGAEAGAGCGSVCPTYDQLEQVVTHEGFEITYRYPEFAVGGDPTTFRITIKNVGDPDRGITKLVHNKPLHFGLIGVTTNRIRHVAAGNRDLFDPIVLDHVHDPEARTVAFTDPSGGPVSVGDGLQFDLIYMASYSQKLIEGAGNSSFTLEGPGFTFASPLVGTVTGGNMRGPPQLRSRGGRRLDGCDHHRGGTASPPLGGPVAPGLRSAAVRSGAVDTAQHCGQHVEPLGADRLAALHAHPVATVVDSAQCRVEVVEFLPCVPEQRGDLGALERDRRALRIVLVIVRRQLGAVQDVGQARGQRLDPMHGRGLLRRDPDAGGGGGGLGHVEYNAAGQPMLP
jgi:hypothetical protein